MLLDSDAPQLFKKKLEKLSPKDPTMKMAFMEVLDRGKVPLPDRVAENVRCSTSSLDVSAGANSLRKISHRTRHVLVSAFLMLSLALVIFWPKDIFPKMAEPKLDAWLNAVQANFSAFLSMEVFAGEEHVPAEGSWRLDLARSYRDGQREVHKMFFKVMFVTASKMIKVTGGD